MGNTNGREEGENGGGEYPPRRSDGGDFLENSGCRVRVPSLDAMGNNTPPESPGRSQSPLLFAPQVPVAPLQRAADIPPVFNQPFINDSHGPLDLPPEQGIPTMITWNYGGKDVAVEGSWDNWTSRKTLQRSGKDQSILLVLPSGIYQYKFIVDGEWRYIPDLPCVADEMGRITNLLDVHDYVPENLESVVEFEHPPSPDSSYGQPFPVDGDFSKEPLAVPSQLHLTILGMQNPTEAASSLKPQHVVLNHLYIEKGWAPQSLVALGLTHRFQSKYVTVVLYKPLRR
ncbi:SNF1-related protein kinase regulatory subunit beta-1-like isoform X2 [Magnolia sinica]|uniref:SNF1-related protein kinase regulatory subunit beta-1-like isoform X1 n=1 Tax=Magnolia sinica TaxID=86752 RepID=UPI002659E584|nr:SNF1-related protein kinase regulatory subunit beta-1-like isoform X1 [Magnolia sinica]XP_058079229.1 SNF1-related protein kinase regulatory subunit beta-1-like isoform X2 [Magnolia sinica]